MKRWTSFLLVLLLLSTSALAYENVPAWAAQGEEFSAAADLGLIPGLMDSADMSGEITRLEFCHTALAIYDTLSGAVPELSHTSPFADTDDASVGRAAALGLVSGYPDGTFRPDSPVTRQELFKMLDNLLAALGRQPGLTSEQAEELVSAFADCTRLQNWATQAAAAMLYLGVTNGNQIGGEILLDPEGGTTRAQAIVMAYRLYCRFHPEDSMAETPLPEGVLEPGTSLTTSGQYADLAAKREFIFGDSNISIYTTEAEAEANQTIITVPVWRLNEDGTKTASHTDLKVHVKLAPTVLQIFTEIFNSPEQFPIKNVGAYNWRGNYTSEHNWGIAIDINWEENYYIRINRESGEPLADTAVGNYWLPGQDPYSISRDSDVVSIFAKYGFGWGGDEWWSNVRDYMHFSFFGR